MKVVESLEMLCGEVWRVQCGECSVCSVRGVGCSVQGALCYHCYSVVQDGPKGEMKDDDDFHDLHF